uniref:EXS domain-containing protein n=3 Tax=Aegilops tauschii subsp. strangulata TaxID=200361 RepID=A0A453SE83_AEGTS
AVNLCGRRVPAEAQAPRLRAQRPGIGGEMKGASVPAVVGMPSPLFLWRFKAILFLLWGLCCCKIGWDSVMRMSADLRDLFLYEVFLYYNPLFLVALMIWLWGVNLWVFAQSSVNYVKVFDLAQTHLSHREIWRCATWLTLIVPTSMTAYLYLYSHGEVSLAASQPVLLYAILLIVLLSPFDMFYLSSRFYFLRTMLRIVLPLQAITFPDFFLADIFTSMSKVSTYLYEILIVDYFVYLITVGDTLTKMSLLDSTT